jgi:hypothetical protein
MGRVQVTARVFAWRRVGWRRHKGKVGKGLGLSHPAPPGVAQGSLAQGSPQEPSPLNPLQPLQPALVSRPLQIPSERPLRRSSV